MIMIFGVADILGILLPVYVVKNRNLVALFILFHLPRRTCTVIPEPTLHTTYCTSKYVVYITITELVQAKYIFSLVYLW